MNNIICKINSKIVTGWGIHCTPVVLKLLFEMAYIKRISVLYDYLGFRYTPNMEKLIVSWICVIFYYFLIQCLEDSKYKEILSLFYYMNFIEVSSVYWMKNESSPGYLLIISWWIFFWCFMFFAHKIYPLKKKQVQYMPKYNNRYIIVLSVLVTLFICYASWRYGDFRLFVSFNDVDEYRRTNPMSAIEAYLFAWTNNFFLPFLLTVHLNGKKAALVLIDCFLFLMGYGIYVNKTILFTMIMIIAIVIVFRASVNVVLSSWVALFLALFQIVCLLFPNIRMLTSINERLLAGPAAIHYYYYDFFLSKSKLFLSQSIFRNIVVSPYDRPVAELIGSSSKYMSGKWNYANNGLFSTAYANFGIIGIIIQPLLIVATFCILLRIINEYNDQIQYAFILTSVFYLISTSYTSWLLTGGVMICIGMLYISRSDLKRLGRSVCNQQSVVYTRTSGFSYK